MARSSRLSLAAALDNASDWLALRPNAKTAAACMLPAAWRKAKLVKKKRVLELMGLIDVLTNEFIQPGPP